MEQQIAQSGDILYDIVRPGLRILFPVTVTLKHTDRIEPVLFGPDDVMFAVADHDD